MARPKCGVTSHGSNRPHRRGRSADDTLLPPAGGNATSWRLQV